LRSQAVSLLNQVPGDPTPDVAVYLLLGHSARRVRTGRLDALTALRRLWVVAAWDAVPESLSLDFLRFDDALELAHNGIHGTEAEMAREFAAFFCEFEEWAPEV
jgi:hypothetical protein